MVVGKRGSVSVRLEANPKPNVTWTLGGRDIVDATRYSSTVVQEWEVGRKIAPLASAFDAQTDLLYFWNIVSSTRLGKSN